MNITTPPQPHQWNFFRAGGFDQVLLEKGSDLLALPHLDHKLWSALSCPIKGIEFDQRTLQLLDSDNDGHIRAPEILAAVTWLSTCLTDSTQLVENTEGVLLSAIATDTDQGQQVLNAAKTLLATIGKADATRVSVADCTDSGTLLAQSRFNGDGIITVQSTDDLKLQGWISTIIDCFGSETDQGGEPGITEAMISRFAEDVDSWHTWCTLEPTGSTLLPVDSVHLWHSVKAKIEDFFLRCHMASYDQRAATVMNSSEEQLAVLSPRLLPEATEEIALLPLSTVSSDAQLHLETGINPAWRELLSRFQREIVSPLLGNISQLSADQWQQMQITMAPYEAWWSAQPLSPITQLSTERLTAWHVEQPLPHLFAIVEQDNAVKPAFDAMIEVERLCRYCRDLLPFANNFVSFRDFYTGRGKAVFQAGTLYLDGRSFDLCITVTDVAKHAVLATLSRVYLVYCDCVRNGGEEKMTIAAAITNGDSDQLLVGRNGIFYDRQGRDWDATIVRIIDHPISIRQAFWDPYKRIGKMAGEAIQKIAAARSKATEEKAVADLVPIGTKKPEAKPAEQAFDVGKFAGIFAAVGLAIGAIGTAIASILTGFFRLPWWQMPLVLVGIMLFISGPSILLAWLKLRQRNLGRLLDANGWAVNTRATINIPFGASLTGMAKLPTGALHSLFDPFAEKRRPWKRWLLLAFVIGACITAWQLGYFPYKTWR